MTEHLFPDWATVALAALMSVSWIVLFFVYRSLDWILRVLLIRAPIWGLVEGTRIVHRIPTLRRALAYREEPRKIKHVDRKRQIVDGLIAWIDTEVTRGAWGKAWFPWLLLPTEDVAQRQFRILAERHIETLNADYSLLCALSLEPERRDTGLLSALGSSAVKPSEVSGVILYLVRFGDDDARSLALFHCPRYLKSGDDVRRLNQVVSSLEEPLREDVRAQVEKFVSTSWSTSSSNDLALAGKVEKDSEAVVSQRSS